MLRPNDRSPQGHLPEPAAVQPGAESDHAKTTPGGEGEAAVSVAASAILSRQQAGHLAHVCTVLANSNVVCVYTYRQYAHVLSSNRLLREISMIPASSMVWWYGGYTGRLAWWLSWWVAGWLGGLVARWLRC